jgi:HEAT repeat protein
MLEKKIHSLIQKLNTAKDTSALKAIKNLQKIGPYALPALLDAAQDNSKPRIQKWSLDAIGAIADRRGVNTLLHALKDPRMTMRLHALRGLGHMNYRGAAKEIIPLLTDDSGAIRARAIATLEKLGDKQCGKYIIRSLADPLWYVQQHAAQACGTLKLRTAQPKLRKLASATKRTAVKKAIVTALNSLDQ